MNILYVVAQQGTPKSSHHLKSSETVSNNHHHHHHPRPSPPRRRPSNQMLHLTTAQQSSPETLDAVFPQQETFFYRRDRLQRENTLPRANGFHQRNNMNNHYKARNKSNGSSMSSLRHASLSKPEPPTYPPREKFSCEMQHITTHR